MPPKEGNRQRTRTTWTGPTGTEARARARRGSKVDRTRRPGQKDNKDYNKSNEELKIVVKALGRLVLHQEDSMSVLRVDTEMVAFMKNRGPKVVPAQDWSMTNNLLTVGNH